VESAGNAATLSKIFSKAFKRNKVLETPLPKHISDKALRIASYTEEKKEISQWDSAVRKNRTAEQLIFPLKQPNYSMQPAANVIKVWKPETDLEKKISELLNQSENNLTDQKLLTQAELKAIESMNLDEVK
jgi:U3 small nucleolar RNA-associated protein 14